jgi:hypothetical protein
VKKPWLQLIFMASGQPGKGNGTIWVNKGKKGHGLIKASSDHEPAVFLCSRQQEANRTPEFATPTLTTLKTYAIKKKAPNVAGPSQRLTSPDVSADAYCGGSGGANAIDNACDEGCCSCGGSASCALDNLV